MRGLLFHLLHQPRALDHIGEARIILDIGGDGELAAGLNSLNQHRFEHRTRGINGRGVARWSRSDDDDLGVNRSGHVPALAFSE